MSAINGQVWEITGSIEIDLQGGLITSVPIRIEATPPGTLVITLANCVPGVLTCLTIWNETGSAIPVQFQAVDIGENPVNVVAQSPTDTVINFLKQTVSLPAGSLNTALGSLITNLDGPNQFFFTIL